MVISLYDPRTYQLLTVLTETTRRNYEPSLTWTVVSPVCLKPTLYVDSSVHNDEESSFPGHVDTFF